MAVQRCLADLPVLVAQLCLADLPVLVAQLAEARTLEDPAVDPKAAPLAGGWRQVDREGVMLSAATTWEAPKGDLPVDRLPLPQPSSASEAVAARLGPREAGACAAAVRSAGPRASSSSPVFARPPMRSSRSRK